MDGRMLCGTMLVLTLLMGQTVSAGVPIQISGGPDTETYPRVSGDRIVWMDNRSQVGWDIYLYDLSTGQEARITDGQGLNFFPRISGNSVVWFAVGEEGDEIWLYNVPDRKKTRLASGTVFYPDISGNRVVWSERRLGRDDVYLHDVTTGVETRITQPPSIPIFPSISGNRIVWIDYRRGNADLVLYDLATGLETLIECQADYRPAISENAVVWMDGRARAWQIWMYDIASGTQRQVSNSPNENWEASISNNRIVWTEFNIDYQDSNIMMYDIATGTATKLTDDPAFQSTPAIDGSQIVWSDFRGGNWDIYMIRLAPPGPVRLDPVGDTFVDSRFLTVYDRFGRRVPVRQVNYGDLEGFSVMRGRVVGFNSFLDWQGSLIQFPDVACTPAKALLHLYHYTVWGEQVSVYRMNMEWKEMEATFNYPYAGAASWAARWHPGGNYAATPTHTARVGSPGWYTFDLTQDVKAFAAGAPNFGWFLGAAGGTSSSITSTAFTSKEARENRPYLEVICE